MAMNHKKISHIIGGLLLYGAGVIFFLTTSPENLPIALLVVPFLYMFVTTYLTTRFLVGQFLVKTPGRANILAGLTAVGVTLLLLLSSLHQLTIRDILLVFGIAVIFIWYLRKT